MAGLSHALSFDSSQLPCGVELRLVARLQPSCRAGLSRGVYIGRVPVIYLENAGSVRCHGHDQLCVSGTRPPLAHLYLRSGIAIIPSASPCLRRGKGQPLRERKGSLCEDEN
jgi:hypothetical protein